MWLVGGAWAHDLAGDVAIRAFVAEGALAGAWTTSGLVRWDADGVWRRVCNESYGGDVNDVWLEPDGTFWLATASGLVEATDGGCAHQVLVAAPTSRIWAFGGHRWVRVEQEEGDQLLHAPPGGALTAVDLPPDLVRVGGFGVGADGGWWISASFAPAGVWTTADGGATWSYVTGPEPDALNVEVFGPAPSGIALSAWHADGRAVVWAGPPWQRQVELPLIPDSLACEGTLCRAALGLALVEWEAIGPLFLVDGPPRALTVVDGRWWGCEARGADGLVATSAEEEPFRSALDRFAIVDRDCPAGTVGASACPVVRPAETAGPADPLVLAPRDCTCAARRFEGPPAAVAWAVFVLAWRRRG